MVFGQRKLDVAILPISYFIFRTTGRGATPLEMILVFVACIWPVAVVNLVERCRRKLLTEAWT